MKVLAVLAALVLSCGCVGTWATTYPSVSGTSTSLRDTAYSTSTTQTTTTTMESAAHGGFEVREWGVLAGCPSSGTYFLTSRPQQTMVVKQPVIYVRSSDKKPFNVRVKFKDGRPTDTYPTAQVNGDTAVWVNVRFSQLCGVKKGLAAERGYVPLQNILSTLNDVDSDCLGYGGQSSRFLFYEGELEFENKVSVEFDFEKQKATFRNSGKYPVYDLTAAAPNGRSFMKQDVYVGAVRSLSPGGKAAVDLKKGGEVDGTRELTTQLVSQGFSEMEARSFSSLWARTFFYPTNVGGWSNIIYRLSQQEYDDMIELDVSPKPDRTIRSLYVLVHVNNTIT